jgi:hypothetical protein
LRSQQRPQSSRFEFSYFSDSMSGQSQKLFAHSSFNSFYYERNVHPNFFAFRSRNVES